MNMWNHTSFPNYKSRLWDMTGSGSGSSSSKQNGGVEKRKAYVPPTLLRLGIVVADFCDRHSHSK